MADFTKLVFNTYQHYGSSVGPIVRAIVLGSARHQWGEYSNWTEGLVGRSMTRPDPQALSMVDWLSELPCDAFTSLPISTIHSLVQSADLKGYSAPGGI